MKKPFPLILTISMLHLWGCSDAFVTESAGEAMSNYSSNQSFVVKKEYKDRVYSVRYIPRSIIVARETMNGTLSECERRIERMEGLKETLTYEVSVSEVPDERNEGEGDVGSTPLSFELSTDERPSINPSLAQQIATGGLTASETYLVQFEGFESSNMNFRISTMGESVLDFAFTELDQIEYKINCEDYAQ